MGSANARANEKRQTNTNVSSPIFAQERAYRSMVARFALDLYFISLIVALTFISFLLLESLTQWGAGHNPSINIIATADTPEIIAGYALLATISVGLQAGIRIPSSNHRNPSHASTMRAKFLRPFVILTQVGAISMLVLTWRSTPWNPDEINVGALAGPAILTLIIFGLCSDALHGHRFGARQTTRIEAVEGRFQHWLISCLRHRGLRRSLEKIYADSRSQKEPNAPRDSAALMQHLRQIILTDTKIQLNRPWSFFRKKKANYSHILGCLISGSALTLLAHYALEEKNVTFSDAQKTVTTLVVMTLLIFGSQVYTYCRRLTLTHEWVASIALFLMWLVISALYSLPYCVGLLNISPTDQPIDIVVYFTWASVFLSINFTAAVMGRLGSGVTSGNLKVVLQCADYYHGDWLRQRDDTRESDLIGTVMQLKALSLIPVIGPSLTLYIVDTALEIPTRDRSILEQACTRNVTITNTLFLSIGICSIIGLVIVAWMS